MLKANIKLNSVDKVKEFVNIASSHMEDIDLMSGKYIIDAKSIMGIFSLDLSKVLQLVIHSDDKKTLKDFDKFLSLKEH